MKTLSRNFFTKKNKLGKLLPATRYLLPVLVLALALSACDKHDPILPGVRTPIFATGEINVENTTVPNGTIGAVVTNTTGNYVQDSNNIIWRKNADGSKTKIFAGMPTTDRVDGTRTPVYKNGFVYAGLSTGELVRVDVNTHAPTWIADIYRENAMTGGASILDIVAPVVLSDGAVFAGGVGDAICRVNDSNGNKVWCDNIGTSVPFIIAGNVMFVVATDNNLYAINIKNGDAYWRAPVIAQSTPKLNGNIISVGTESFDATNGKKTNNN